MTAVTTETAPLTEVAPHIDGALIAAPTELGAVFMRTVGGAAVCLWQEDYEAKASDMAVAAILVAESPMFDPVSLKKGRAQNWEELGVAVLRRGVILETTDSELDDKTAKQVALDLVIDTGGPHSIERLKTLIGAKTLTDLRPHFCRDDEYALRRILTSKKERSVIFNPRRWSQAHLVGLVAIAQNWYNNS